MPTGFHPRRQGDLGEAAAIHWLSAIGAIVSFPLFHSPDYDLIAEVGGRLLRVQVKTSRYEVASTGHFAVQLATSGGNQSWTGTVKTFDPTRVDYVFVLVGTGRCWFIPSNEVEGHRSVHVGGAKYSEFEVRFDISLDADGQTSRLESDAEQGEYPSGQRGGTVNAMAQPSQVRILPPPSNSDDPPDPPTVGRTRMSRNHQVTVPLAVAAAASIEPGDRFRVEPDGTGRFVMTRIEEYMEQHVDQLALPDQAREPAGAERRAPD
jgi:bifunctional DNA-binding transcriptional regulator/antitoxin component of YhaV-PrlF toxin-antitoxin module